MYSNVFTVNFSGAVWSIVVFRSNSERVTGPWSIDREIQAPVGLLTVSTPPTFTPIVVNLRLSHTLPDFQELERRLEEGTTLWKKEKGKPALTYLLFRMDIPRSPRGRKGGAMVCIAGSTWASCRGEGALVLSAGKLWKEVPLKFLFVCFPPPVQFTRSVSSSAVKPPAIMARRIAEAQTPRTRAAFRDQHLPLRGGSVAFSWRLALICSALSCGYCGAETEFSILEEAQVLAEQMKKLSSQELGVFTMQVIK